MYFVTDWFTIFSAILYIDRKGFTGKKVEFQNIPYSTILNFATESCGSFDTDSELKLTFATPWFPSITQDFRSGKADIVAIQNLIAAKTLGPPGKPSDFANDDTIKPVSLFIFFVYFFLSTIFCLHFCRVILEVWKNCMHLSVKNISRMIPKP